MGQSRAEVLEPGLLASSRYLGTEATVATAAKLPLLLSRPETATAGVRPGPARLHGGTAPRHEVDQAIVELRVLRPAAAGGKVAGRSPPLLQQLPRQPVATASPPAIAARLMEGPVA